VIAAPAAAAGTVPMQFVAEGPNGVFGTPGMSQGTEPWSGAVTAVVPDHGARERRPDRHRERRHLAHDRPRRRHAALEPGERPRH
jgi:hypothetical protein